MDDKSLVQGLLQKDGPSERFLFQTYRLKLHRTATFILGYNDPEVEDVVQEAFLAALQDLPKFKFHCPFFHWLRRILVYRCYERIRRRKRQAASAQEDLEKFTAKHAVEKDKKKSDEHHRQALVEVLKTEQESLGERCRELLDLRESQDKSYAELSRHFKVAIGTIMSRLARCKEELKQRVLRAARKRGLLDG